MSYMTQSRRSFLKTLGTAAFVAPFVTKNLIANPPSERVRFAAFGTANMAGYDVSELTSHPKVDFVAAADVDSNYLKSCIDKYKTPKPYADYRELLEKEKDIDCINVSTPDHTHAVMAMSAMQRGIHVYCQKPLAHDIYEVRQMMKYAAEHKIVTQMGIQIHGAASYRNTVKLIKEGLIGKIKETWSWCGNGYGSKDPLPEKEDPIPENLNWDLWLNTAAVRPYLKGQYHPSHWRYFQDLGTGALGDMQCHIFDNIFSALDIKAPLTIRSEGAAPGKDFWEAKAIVHYSFPKTEFIAGDTLTAHWYNGGELPPEDIRKLFSSTPGSGTIFAGTKGYLLVPHYSMEWKNPVLLKDGEGYSTMPEEDVKKLATLPSISHWHQFIDAVRGEAQAAANFDYAGPLAEAAILGTIATRFPHATLKWDAANMKFDVAEANQYIRRQYRKGWEVEGL